MDFYKKIVENAPFGFAYHKLIVDINNNPIDYEFININNAFEKIAGINKEAIIGKKVTEVLPGIKEERFDWIGFYGKIALENGRKEFEHYSETLHKWYKVEVKSDENYYFTTIFIDITEEKLQIKELEESKENFRNFFETIDDMIFIADKKGKIFFTNSAVNKKLGYTQEELEKMHVLDVHSSLKRKEAEKIFTEMFAGELEVCPLPLETKNNLLVPVETRVWFGSWDGEECIFGISKDLSKEQELLQKFNKLFHGNPALMAVTRIDNRKITEVNQAFLDNLGYAREEVIGNTSENLNFFVDQDKKSL